MYVITFKNNMKQFSIFLFYRLLITMYGNVQQCNKKKLVQNNNKTISLWADLGVFTVHYI